MASRKKLIGMAIVAAAAIGMSGCQQDLFSFNELGQPARVDAKTNEAEYAYVYYPEQQVYFEPHSKMYFWFEDDAWYEGNVLPNHLSLRNEYFQIVQLDTHKPWTHHVTVTSKFGGGNKPMAGMLDPANYDLDPTMQPGLEGYGATTEITAVDPSIVQE